MNKSKKILVSILPFSILINLSLTVFLVLTSHFIANNLLHNPNAYLPILAISLVLPFDSLSSMLRGFFFGKEKMMPHVLSHLMEQVVRLIIICLFINKVMAYGIVKTICFISLVNIIGSEFYTGVPDSQLKALCNFLMDKYGIDPKHHVIAANVFSFTTLCNKVQPLLVITVKTFNIP